VPVGDVLVRDTRCHVEHDDTTLAINVIAISKTAKLLLTGRVPHVELDLAEVLRMRQPSVSSAKARVKRSKLTVLKPRGWTSTPRVAMYFFSNSPVRWRLTKVV